MRRLLGFSGGGQLLKLLPGVLLLPLLLLAGVSAWLYWSLTPLQRFYFPIYAASSLAQSHPDAISQIRWVMKTASGRESVTLLPADAVRGGTAGLPVALSPKARAEGWQGVALSPQERGPAFTLARLLEHGFYDDEGLSQLLFFPLLIGAAGLMALTPVLWKAKERVEYELWSWGQSWTDQRRRRRSREPQLTSAARSNRATGPGGIRLSRLTSLLPFGSTSRMPKRLEGKMPRLSSSLGPKPVGPPAVPATRAVAAVPTAVPETPKKPVQSAQPLAPAAAAKPKAAVVWDESKGIE